MSRAVSSSILSLVFVSFAAGSVLAGSPGSSAPGQGPVAVGPARPAAAPIRTFSREREAAPRIDGFYSTPVWRTEQTIVVVTPEQRQRQPVTMLSGNPIDPGATISRTPSGSVVIGPPPNLIFVAPLPQAARPYAPPEFHMIGAPSARNMGAPVKLTHGIKPPETLKTGPKVVWLNEAGGSGDDAGGRIKRLR